MVGRFLSWIEFCFSWTFFPKQLNCVIKGQNHFETKHLKSLMLQKCALIDMSLYICWSYAFYFLIVKLYCG